MTVLEVLRESGFLRNVFTILKGSVAAQLIAVMALPLLTRLFSPQTFGVYQVYVSVLSWLLVAASLRYEIAIMHARSEDEAQAGIALCVLLNCSFACLVALACAVWSGAAAEVTPTAKTFGWWLAPAVLFAGLGQTLSYVALRARAYNANAQARVFQSAVYAAIGLLAGSVKAVTSSLLAADVAGRAAAAIRLFAKSRVRVGQWRGLVLSGALKRFASHHRKFALVALPAGLLNVAGLATTPLFMFLTFDPATAGQYALVDRCIQVPIGLVTQAVSQVFTSEFSALLGTRPSAAAGLLRSTVLVHFKLAAGPALGLLIGGPVMIEWVFGSQWAQAGYFARLMSPLFLISFVVGPVNMALVLLRKQELQLLWDGVRFGTSILLWTSVAHWRLTPGNAVALHVWTNVAIYLLFLLIIYREYRKLHAWT